MGIRLEVLKWEDTSGGNQLVQRVPEGGMADLKLGARVLVYESQAAVFFRNGKALDVLRAGSHTLTTENIPLVSKLFNLVYQDNPFQSAVYFISLKPVVMKWGTTSAITIEDSKFGVVNLRAFGKFSMRVTDPQMFIGTVVGTQGRENASQVEGLFRTSIVEAFTSVVGAVMEGKSILQIRRFQSDISAAVKTKTADDFAKYGLEVIDLKVESINLPESLQQKLDELAGMNAVKIGGGSMQDYMQYTAANTMEKAAASGNPGLNAGLSFGMMGMVPGMMGPAMGGMGYGGAPPGMMGVMPGMASPMMPPPLPPAVTFFAAINGAQAGPFDANALRAQIASGAVNAQTLVWRPGMAAWTPAGSVAEVAGLFAPPPMAAAPPPLPPPMPR